MQAEEQVKIKQCFYQFDVIILDGECIDTNKSVMLQVRLSKDRKKGEKIVTDSQERAFWRVHRPPPGCVSVMEQIPIKIGGSFSTKKKRSSEDLRREVNKTKYNTLTRANKYINIQLTLYLHLKNKTCVTIEYTEHVSKVNMYKYVLSKYRKLI